MADAAPDKQEGQNTQVDCSVNILKFTAFGKCSANLPCSLTCRQMRFSMKHAVSKHPTLLCKSTCCLCWRGEQRSKTAGQ